MDFLGNISLRVVGVLCTLAVMAGAYFFFVKPALDTTSDAIDKATQPLNGINETIQESMQQAQQAQQQAQQSGNPGQAAGINLDKLRKCMAKASKQQNAAAVQQCSNKYGP